jgi:hypothetical protein
LRCPIWLPRRHVFCHVRGWKRIGYSLAVRFYDQEEFTLLTVVPWLVVTRTLVYGVDDLSLTDVREWVIGETRNLGMCWGTVVVVVVHGNEPHKSGKAANIGRFYLKGTPQLR